MSTHKAGKHVISISSNTEFIRKKRIDHFDRFNHKNMTISPHLEKKNKVKIQIRNDTVIKSLKTVYTNRVRLSFY